MTNLLLGGLKGLRLALVLGLTGHLAVPTAAVSSKMDYLPLASVRTDPVINPTCLSDHVHTYYGANASLRPSTAYAELRAAAGNSGAVEENKSLYWHPSVYKFSPATGLYTLAEISFATAYYVWESATTAPTTAFPNGFKMLAYGSDPKARLALPARNYIRQAMFPRVEIKKKTASDVFLCIPKTKQKITCG